MHFLHQNSHLLVIFASNKCPPPFGKKITLPGHLLQTIWYLLDLQNNLPVWNSQSFSFLSAPPVANILPDGENLTAFTSPSWASWKKGNLLLVVTGMVKNLPLFREVRRSLFSEAGIAAPASDI